MALGIAAGMSLRRRTSGPLRISVVAAQKHDHGPCAEPTGPGLHTLEFFPLPVSLCKPEVDDQREPNYLSDPQPAYQSSTGVIGSVYSSFTGTCSGLHVGGASESATPNEESYQNGDNLSREASTIELTPFEKNWTEIRRVGQGAHGYVSLATRKTTCLGFKTRDRGKLYAVKQSKHATQRSTGFHSLHKERQNHWLASLASSAIGSELFAFMVDYDRASNPPTWLSMTYYDGPTLWEAQKRFKWLPASFVFDVAVDILDALEWLHAPNDLKPSMAHGDLHAANVLIDLSRPVSDNRYPHIRILDLGLANHAYWFDGNEKWSALSSAQHSDINDFGNLVHSLAHQDHRTLGRGPWKDPFAVSHCFESQEHGPCPYVCDPYTNQLFNEHDPYWSVIIRCCYTKYGHSYCDTESQTPLSDLKRHLTPYMRSKRDFWFQPCHRDWCIGELKSMCQPVPDLSPGHILTPSHTASHDTDLSVQPSQDGVTCEGSGGVKAMQAQRKRGFEHDISNDNTIGHVFKRPRH